MNYKDLKQEAGGGQAGFNVSGEAHGNNNNNSK